jgi:hypothetical protein
MELPAWLSEVPEKRLLFGVDPFFHDSWADVGSTWGDAAGSEDVLGSLALLVLRPDAVVARTGTRIIEALTDHGFTTAAVRPVRFDRRLVREMWRYELVASTPSRIALLSSLLSAERSLLMMLRRAPGGSGNRSASRLLGELKGPSRADDRRRGQLRSIAGNPQVSALTYLHSADEAADVVRELGILLNQRARAKLLAAVRDGRDRTDKALALLRDTEARTRAHDLHLEPALERIARALTRRGGAEPLGRLRELTRDPTPEGLDWLFRLRARGTQVDPWDVITTAAWLCPPRPPRPDAFARIRQEITAQTQEG